MADGDIGAEEPKQGIEKGRERRKGMEKTRK